MQTTKITTTEELLRGPEAGTDDGGYREDEDIALSKKAIVPEEEVAPYEEGYGIGDAEPAGTNTYDFTDEWN